MIFYHSHKFDFGFPIAAQKDNPYLPKSFKDGYFKINGKVYREDNEEFREAVAADTMWETLRK